MFCNMIHFYGVDLSAPRPTPKLDDHPLQAVRDCLFNIFVATLHIGGRSSIRKLRTRHAVVAADPFIRASAYFTPMLLNLLAADCGRSAKSPQTIILIVGYVYAVKRRTANLLGHILRSNRLLGMLLKEKWKGQGEEEEDVRRYWMVLRKREHIG